MGLWFSALLHSVSELRTVVRPHFTDRNLRQLFAGIVEYIREDLLVFFDGHLGRATGK
jgi:hypothetical protein